MSTWKSFTQRLSDFPAPLRILLVGLGILFSFLITLLAAWLIFPNLLTSIRAMFTRKQPETMYKNLSPENAELIEEFAAAWGLMPSWVAKVIYLETAGTFSTTISNPTTGATGWFQFMPQTALSLGTNVAEIKQMSASEQLRLFEAYLESIGKDAGEIKSESDLYFAIFFPAAIGRPDDWVLQTSSLSASRIATANKGFDVNKDSKITVKEVKEYLQKI